MRHLFLFAILWSTLLQAEKPTLIFRSSSGEDLTQSKDIQARAPVFIYYAADVRPAFRSLFQDHLRKIQDALLAPETEGAADERAFLSRVRDYIQFDLEVQRASADREVTELVSELCRANGRFRSHVAFFQNSSHPAMTVNKGSDVISSFDVCRAEDTGDSTTRVIWEVENVGSILRMPQWEDQFLSNPTVFAKAIQEVMTQFPSDKHRFLLMIRGQGDAENIFKSQYAFDSSTLDSVRLRKEFIAHMKDFGGQNFKMEPALSGKIHEILGRVLPPLPGELEVSKWQFLEYLAALGGGNPLDGVFFSQVMLNTFGGPLEKSVKLKGLVKADDYSGLNVGNIGGIRHFGEVGMNGPAPFDKLADFFGPTPTFEERLNQLLDRVAKGVKP